MQSFQNADDDVATSKQGSEVENCVTDNSSVHKNVHEMSRTLNQ